MRYIGSTSQTNVKSSNSFLRILLLCICTLWLTAAADVTTSETSIAFVGSTPGDELIKSILGIKPGKNVDFIRWHLTLGDPKTERIFSLKIIYGEAQPNTLGFKGGGENDTFDGRYTVVRDKKGPKTWEIYRLKSSRLSSPLLIVRLNENLFHLLTPDSKLMVGNGGWSYTLNRENPVIDNSILLPPAISSGLTKDTTRQLIFDGRTPCRDFAKEYNVEVPGDCLKLKWRIILNRDAATLSPATYIIQRTDSRQSDIRGTWSMVKGHTSNADAIIYRLDPDKPDRSVSLLAGDENVLFLLNKEDHLYVGNSDFSYTLNRNQ